ncbi:hypothetical protein MFIFM68171_03518 [Madurella fahalii]|uniref:Uncharacterized protein n=1 Tax=Madurella fahalii TaxID=1157608 RepID=A0ABQ0G6B5_9PEZI
MLQLTVGSVAGLISALFFILRISAPTVLVFILSGLLNNRNPAITWTVAGQAFQGSYWPFLLRSDSFYHHGVHEPVRLLLVLMPAMSTLIAIAGIITPIGLYRVLDQLPATKAQFQVGLDSSAFGYGTPPRSGAPFSRRCGGGTGVVLPSICPVWNASSTETNNTTGESVRNSGKSYIITIPESIIKAYSSGTLDSPTISGFFDIQYRHYMTAMDPRISNGSGYQMGLFRFVESLILDTGFRVIEGLVVDLNDGGVGFRNHSLPLGFPNGVSWSEDLLFIEPETVCVDTNLALEYTMATMTIDDPMGPCQDTGTVTNISTIMIWCGLMHGAPRRRDGGSDSLLESGSQWTQPIYSCASAVKAKVKTVSFTYNRTTSAGSANNPDKPHSLAGLSVTEIKEKTYNGQDPAPLWGVEQTYHTSREESTSSRVYCLFTAQIMRRSLSIAGGLQSLYNMDNLAVSKFYAECMRAAYAVSSGRIQNSRVDYTGQSNIAMLTKWQGVTRPAPTAGRFIDLIWTDYAASLVVGTKGLHDVPTSSTKMTPLVTPMVLAVQDDYLYGIPAMLVGLGFLLLVLAALAMMLLLRHNIDRLRLRIQQTSSGRIFTTLLNILRAAVLILVRRCGRRKWEML